MYRGVEMAVPKTTQARCMDGSVQITQGVQRPSSNPIPTPRKIDVRMGYLCSLNIPCVVCTLP